MAQAQQKGKPEDTEVWEPVPKVVTASPQFTPPPSDAIVLFDGKDLTQWVSADDRNAPAKWKVAGGIFTVDKKTGNIETKRAFTNYQLHLEWRVPATIAGTGQVRGNSGLFLASLGKGDLGYELQILDSYENKTYVNGMAGSIYKQLIPLANPTRKPGEWQSYDVLWTAPTFKADGSVQSPARVTVLFNGVVVQNNVTLAGPTVYIGKPSYQKHGPSPIKLQSHGDPSEPLSFRNIWVREL
ncbi:endo-1,3-1,4-beta glucanase-related protein [Hymenobacter qilianensis]|nr:endo-1,3-1,4-beta glucanase-related protein [Hymenobacter qilianensis]